MEQKQLKDTKMNNNITENDKMSKAYINSTHLEQIEESRADYYDDTKWFINFLEYEKIPFTPIMGDVDNNGKLEIDIDGNRIEVKPMCYSDVIDILKELNFEKMYFTMVTRNEKFKHVDPKTLTSIDQVDEHFNIYCYFID